MMRTGEAVYKELGLKQIEQDAALLAAMVAHPILLERPLVSDGRCAVICRPPELAAEFLD
jgi:arsenate reductase